jgi:hypothetical protein
MDRGYGTGSVGNAAAPSKDRSLFQETEMIRGISSELLKRIVDVAQRFGAVEPSLEKDTARPERTHNIPANILRNAYEDLAHAVSLIEQMDTYLGRPGEGR